MKIRGFALLGILGAAVLASAPANAAVTVLGNGIARSCFDAAEFGGDVNDGLAACTTALEETALSISDRAATYINRGILKSRKDDMDGALDDYNKGLSIDADLGEGYVDRGAIMIMYRRYADAVQDIDKGIGLGSQKLQIAYYDRAIAHEALGNVRAAYEDYKKAVEIDPSFTLAADQLARFKVVVHKHSDGT